LCAVVIRPETQAYIQKLEQEKIEKAKGQQADNRGFFAKYVSYTARCIPGLYVFYAVLSLPIQLIGGTTLSN